MVTSAAGRREDLDAQCLGLLRHPAHDVGQAGDVVAVVAEVRRQQEVGHAPGALLVHEEEDVLGHGHVQRRALFLPVGDQLRQRDRVDDRARQDVRAGLGALLEHHDRNLLALLLRQLLQVDGGGQPRGAAADHHHVVFHRFARAVLGQDFFLGHGVSSIMVRTLGSGRPWQPHILCGGAGWSNDRAISLSSRSFRGLQHRLVRACRLRHRRLQRARGAVRAHAGPRRRGGGARGAAHREAEGPARADRRRGRGRARGAARRDRRRLDQVGGGACRDRDGIDRHPRQQLGRQHHAAHAGRERRRFRLRLQHQRARRLLRRAGGRQAHAGAFARRGARHLHRRPHHQHRPGGRPRGRRCRRSACTPPARRR